MFYETGIKKMVSRIQCCYTDASGLMTMAYQDNRGSTVRNSASQQVMTQGAKFQGIKSMVLKNSLETALPETCGKCTAGQASRVALPAFLTYKAFDTQQSDSLWKSQMLEQARSKAEALRDKAMSAYQFIRELFTWVLTKYTSMGHEEPSSDTSASNWKFVSKSVKAIFHKLQLLREGEQLTAAGPGHKAWACI